MSPRVAFVIMESIPLSLLQLLHMIPVDTGLRQVTAPPSGLTLVRNGQWLCAGRAEQVLSMLLVVEGLVDVSNCNLTNCSHQSMVFVPTALVTALKSFGRKNSETTRTACDKKLIYTYTNA
jgi:hypothetical protein